MTAIRIGNFEWDTAKAASNLKKHGVAFNEAMECFLDPLGLELADALDPGRFILIAHSGSQRILFIVYAELASGAIVRIISARRATAHEKKLYQNKS